ncbi:hypothetical protein H6P81_005423 [Aristolochia fimbriata]|uniref:adenylate kinase n=1 Tax=Aristolochia fimbriata TaxID=158543 RepID=A0AAV7EV52_ARIFI|nr:hypothetical protein H6P81_005423 [Aristolochia fimbriata]
MAAPILNRLLRLQPFPSSFSSLRCFTALASEAQLGFADSLSHQRVHTRPDHASKNVQWIFLGCPGVGKGTYASRLSQLLGVPHIATGDLVRAELKNSGPLADQLKEIVNQGKLVSDEIIINLLSKRLEEGEAKGESGFILDGFPRTIRQAEILEGVTDIDLVVNLKLREDVLIEKCLGRRTCNQCGGNFNVACIDVKAENGKPGISMAPLLPPPQCSSKLIVRSDDTEEVVKARLQIYNEVSQPVEEFYRNRGMLMEFDLPGGIPESWPKLLEALNLDDHERIRGRQVVELSEFEAQYKRLQFLAKFNFLSCVKQGRNSRDKRGFKGESRSSVCCPTLIKSHQTGALAVGADSRHFISLVFAVPLGRPWVAHLSDYQELQDGPLEKLMCPESRIFHYSARMPRTVSVSPLHIDNICRKLICISSDNLIDLKCNLSFQQRSFITQSAFLGQDSSNAALLHKLELSLKDHQLNEAWRQFNNYKNLYGYPEKSFLRRFIIELIYSSNSHWLSKAHRLVLSIFREKPNLLDHDFLVKLALALARAQMPIPASSVLRNILEKNKCLPTDLWATIFLHMVKTQIGACIALNLLVDISESFLNSKGNYGSTVTKHSKLTPPPTIIFNLVLNASVGFGATIKAQQVIEDLMPRLGIKADAGTIVIISLIYEKNGVRNDLKQLKQYVDAAPDSLNYLYQMFYNSLLSLHFKFNDIDAAATLILDLYKREQPAKCSCKSDMRNNGLQRPLFVHIGSPNRRSGLKLQIEPDILDRHISVNMKSSDMYVMHVDGKLVVSNKALAMIISEFIRVQKVTDISNLLIGIEKGICFPEKSRLSSDVVDALVQLGWLEAAHDILDEFESAGVPLELDMYKLLVRTYSKEHKFKEAKVLLRQMRKTGWIKNFSDEEAISACLKQNKKAIPDYAGIKNSSLAYFLSIGTKEIDPLPPLIYEFNSSIHFFCKAKMIEDALKVFQKFQRVKLRPTVQTFSFLVDGYSSLCMYRKITILWGETKRRIETGDLAVNRDLLECFLLNFIKGGYFERVMEIAGYMTRNSLFVDTWKYKQVFLTLHKDLYKRLKASQARTEAQSKRLEHVQDFKKWVGIV